jgi:hypothetical protein
VQTTIHVDLLGSMEHFMLNRLNSYTTIPLTGTMAKLLPFRSMVLLSTIALVTKLMKLKQSSRMLADMWLD